MEHTTATIRVVRFMPECCGAAEGEADVAAAGVGEVEEEDGEDVEAGVSFAAAELKSAATELTEPMNSLSGLTLAVACDIALPAMLARSSATECRGFCCIVQNCDRDVAQLEVIE